MNTKPERIQFLKDTREYIKSYGGVSIESRYSWAEDYEFKGKNGKFTMSLREQSDHKELYSVFGRFDYFNQLTGRTTMKYNFHSCEKMPWVAGYVENYIGHIIDELER